MAYEIPGFVLGTLEANIDMSATSQTPGSDSELYTYQYTPVNVAAATGAGLLGPAAVIAIAASGDPAIGILQNNPQLGEAAAIMTSGVTKVKAAGTIAIGDKLAAVPQGGVVTALTGYYVIGRALESAVPGDYFTMLLERDGKV